MVDIRNVKKNDKLIYVSCDFDGCSMDEVVVKEVYDDHIICYYTAKVMQGISLWIEPEFGSKNLFYEKDYEKAKKAFQEEKEFYNSVAGEIAVHIL